jgi:hypothetical protein
MPPPGIEQRQIDIGTGKLASDWCGPSRLEYFKSGTAPVSSCENEVQWSMRDLIPPDWHEGAAGMIDHEQLSEAVEAVLEGTDANARLRAVGTNIMREVRRAAQRMRQERDRQPSAPSQPPPAPVPPR